MNELIAERRICSISTDGQKKVFKIAIGKPYQVDDASWACPVKIDGLYKKLKDPVGIDSWQALNLAISLVQQLLGYFVEDGGKLYWEEDGEALALNDLFPQSKSL